MVLSLKTVTNNHVKCIFLHKLNKGSQDNRNIEKILNMKPTQLNTRA